MVLESLSDSFRTVAYEMINDFCSDLSTRLAGH